MNPIPKDRIVISGVGYSSDTQELTSAVCYNVVSENRGGQQSYLKFDQSSTLEEILYSFNFSVDFKFDYWMIKANMAFEYLNSIKESAYSFSIYYYEKISQEVHFTYSYNLKTILTDVGLGIYQDSNKLYRILCGDYLVRSYEEGAVLLFSLSLKFYTREDKEEFKAKIGISFASFVSVSEDVHRLATSMNKKGQITLSALQMGGHPEDLSNLISSSIVGCDIEHVEECKKTSERMMDYASKDFPAQFKSESGIWTGPLIPIGEPVIDHTVEDFGFDIGPSYATVELVRARDDLLGKLKVAKFFSDSLSDMIKNYPFELRGDVVKYAYMASSDYNFLKQGKDLYKYPHRGMQIYQDILSKINLNLRQDIEKALVNLQFYVYHEISGYKVANYLDADGKCCMVLISNPNPIPNYYCNHLGHFRAESLFGYYFEANSTLEGSTYVGEAGFSNESKRVQFRIPKKLNPYYPIYKD